MKADRVPFAEMETKFLQCRAVNHPWEEWTPLNARRPRYGWTESYRCTRCGAERHDTINVMGEVVQRQYRYPDGYQLLGRPGKAGRMPANKAAVRVELHTRVRPRRRRAA